MAQDATKAASINTTAANHKIAEALADALAKHTVRGEMAGTSYVDTKAALEEVAAQHGDGAVLNVIAHYVQANGDGRINSKNRAWAQDVVNGMSDEERQGFLYSDGKPIYLSALGQAHMTVIDGLAKRAGEHIPMQEQSQEDTLGQAQESAAITREASAEQSLPLVGKLTFPDGSAQLYHSESDMTSAYVEALQTHGAYAGVKYEVLLEDPAEHTAFDNKLVQAAKAELQEQFPAVIGEITHPSGETIIYTDPEKYLAGIQEAFDIYGINGWQRKTYSEDPELHTAVDRLVYSEFGLDYDRENDTDSIAMPPEIIGEITHLQSGETTTYTDPEKYLAGIQEASDTQGLHGWRYHTISEDPELNAAVSNLLHDPSVPFTGFEGDPYADDLWPEDIHPRSTEHELSDMYTLCAEYELEIRVLQIKLANLRESEAYIEDERMNGKNGAAVSSAYNIEEKLRILTEKLAELKRRIVELGNRLRVAVTGKVVHEIQAVQTQITGIRIGLDNAMNSIKQTRSGIAMAAARFVKPEKTTGEKVMQAVKNGDLVAFHQSISAQTENLPAVFAAALARDDKIGNAMMGRVLEALEACEIDKLTSVEQSAENHIRIAKSRAFAALQPVEALRHLILDKKHIAAGRLLEDKRFPAFLQSPQGGEALYTALQTKNTVIARGIAPHLNAVAFNRCLRLALDNLDARSAGNAVRLGANAGAFIKLTALEDKVNPFLTDKQRKFMNDLTKFWNNEQTKEAQQAQSAEEVEQDV